MLCCALMLCGLSADAQGFFTDSGDAVLEYVRTTAQDGKFKWRHTMRVTDVKETESSVRYTTSSVFSKQNGKPLYRDAVIETTYVDRRTGNLSLDLGAAMASYIKARTGINATSSGLLSCLPADIVIRTAHVPDIHPARIYPRVNPDPWADWRLNVSR